MPDFFLLKKDWGMIFFYKDLLGEGWAQSYFTWQKGAVWDKIWFVKKQVEGGLKLPKLAVRHKLLDQDIHIFTRRISLYNTEFLHYNDCLVQQTTFSPEQKGSLEQLTWIKPKGTIHFYNNNWCITLLLHHKDCLVQKTTMTQQWLDGTTHQSSHSWTTHHSYTSRTLCYNI